MNLPVNILGFIPFGLLTIAIGVWLLLSEKARTLPIDTARKRGLRVGLALALAVWFAVALVVTRSGLLLGEGALPAVGVGIALMIPILLVLTAYRLWPTLRAAVDAVPIHWLIGFQFTRNLGFAFLALADVGLLPTAFANPAGYGDVLVGLLAPLVALAYLRRLPYARGLAVAWNILGLLDFVVALGTAIANVAAFPSPFVLSWIQLVPAFGVPLFILLHLATLRRLLRAQPEVFPRVGLTSTHYADLSSS
jgi:hypothetical protein